MDHAWDNQLDTMLDDLQASVQNNSVKTFQTEKHSEVNYSVTQQSYYSSSVSENFVESGSKSLISDLSSIEKVKSVNKSSERSVSTQQSLKKNINDLDYLLNNLSSHNSSREASPSLTLSKSEEKRKKLTLGTSGTSRVIPLVKQEDKNSENKNYNKEYIQRSSSFNKYKSEFFPVHTTPDPLTGRYADGRITPNHGFTRNFHDKQVLSQNHQIDNNGNIPKKPDDLLQSFGQQIEHSELEKINENESNAISKMNAKQEYFERENPEFVPCRPIFYPTEEMYVTTNASANYQVQKKSKSKNESEEKGGAAVIPLCLPLCCAAPCVIM